MTKTSYGAALSGLGNKPWAWSTILSRIKNDPAVSSENRCSWSKTWPQVKNSANATSAPYDRGTAFTPGIWKRFSDGRQPRTFFWVRLFRGTLCAEQKVERKAL